MLFGGGRSKKTTGSYMDLEGVQIQIMLRGLCSLPSFFLQDHLSLCDFGEMIYGGMWDSMTPQLDHFFFCYYKLAKHCHYQII